MTEETARKVANVVVAAAALGTLYIVVRTPALRRRAWRLLVTSATTTVPAWFGRELERAWGASGRREI